MDSKSNGHLPALDGVRGVAIVLVVAHMLNPLDDPTSVAGRIAAVGFGAGWTGVQLFFVLSGFLITGILLDTQGAPNQLQSFFARRVLRIFPLYYATLVVAFVVLPLLGRGGPALAHDRAHQVWLWTYLGNWVATTDAASQAFPHFWSLAVEEQFYLLWPFVVRGRSPRSCFNLSLAVAAAALLVRSAAWRAGVSADAIYHFTITRVDALALGAAAAAAVRIPALATLARAWRGRLWGASAAVGLLGALLTSMYSRSTVAGATVGYTLLSIAFALAVLAAFEADAAPAAASWLRAPALRALGKYSYAMYVFHKPLHDAIGRPLLRRLAVGASRSVAVSCAYVACGLAVTFVVAFVSYHLWERRFLSLKSRFVPRRAEPVDLQ
jgi:peptidoglycan/LPS O-acetylase OafA/YrhL